VGLEVADTPHVGPDDIPSPVRTAAGQIRMLCPVQCATRSKHSLFRTRSFGCGEDAVAVGLQHVPIRQRQHHLPTLAHTECSWIEAPALRDHLGGPDLAHCSTRLLVEHVTPGAGHPSPSHERPQNGPSGGRGMRPRSPSVPRSAGGCPGELQRPEGTRRASATSGGCSSTAGETGGTSGSICAPEKGDRVASCG
jgi:hypothetical protein